MSSSSTATRLFENFVGEFYSRRLLLPLPLHVAPTAPSPPTSETSHDTSEPVKTHNTFDANVVMVLSVLFCALICSLGLNLIIRCASTCSNFVSSDSANPSSRSTNKGVKQNALKTFPTVSYSPDLKLPGLDTQCVICLSEFVAGEHVRLLPKCNHGFHVPCIDKWLSSHSSCPTCRHCLMDTCEKIVGSGQSSTLDPQPPPPPTLIQETNINMTPLEPEGLIRIYRN